MKRIPHSATNSGHFRLVMYVIAAILLTAVPSPAQQARIDSLLGVLRTSQPDTAKVDVLNDIASAYYRNRDTQKSSDYAKEALNLAETLGYREGMLPALIRIGRIHMERRSYPEAIENYQKAIKIGDQLGDELESAKCLFNISVIHMQQASYPTALEYLRKSMEIGQKLGNRSFIARCHQNFGVIYLRQYSYSKSLEHYQKCLQIAEELGNTSLISLTLREMGKIYFNQESYTEALECQQKRLKLCEGIENTRCIARCFSDIAKIYYRQGDNSEALKQFRKSLRIYEQLGDKRKMAGCLVNMGTIQSGTKAMECYRKSLNLFEEIGYTRGIAACLSRIGLIYMQRGSYPEAHEHIGRSLKIFEELGARREETLCLSNIGATYVRQSHNTEQNFYTEALEHFRKSLKISEEIGYKRGVVTSTGQIAGVLLDLEQYPEALSYFERQHDLWQQAGEGGGEGDVTTISDIGWCQYKMGNPDSALIHLHRSLEMAEELDASGPTGKSLSRLNLVYASLGDYEKAYEYHCRATAHGDSLRDEENRKQMNELMAEHEAEQLEKEIELLEKDKRFKEAELDRRQDALERHRLESLQRSQEMELLASQHEIQQLEIDRAATELALQKAETERNEQRVALLEEKRALQSSELDRETLIRNGAIAAFILLLIYAALVYRRIRERRHTSELRAESAEYKARAAEAQSLATAIESERRERQLQQQYSRRLLDAQEMERKRMAGELHDSIGQEALVIKNRIRRALNRHDPNPELRSDLEKTVETSSVLLEDIRRITHNLRPMQLERSGLTETLRDLVQQLRESTALTVDSNVDDIDGIFSREREMDVYRIVQEGLNNTIRHADAGAVTVRIQKDNGTVRVLVADDGKGFDLTKVTQEERGLGLQGISERVQMLGGILQLDAAPGEGTKLNASIPRLMEA